MMCNIITYIDAPWLINRISFILFQYSSGLNVKQLMASIREGLATRVLLFEVLWEPGATGRSDRPINGENDLNPVTRYNENAFWGGCYYYHKVPLMPRSRIDRRKTKPTAEERNGNFNCAKGRTRILLSSLSCASPPTPPHFPDYFQILTVTSFLFPSVSLRCSLVSASLGSNEWRLNAQHLIPVSRFSFVQYRVQLFRIKWQIIREQQILIRYIHYQKASC